MLSLGYYCSKLLSAVYSANAVNYDGTNDFASYSAGEMTGNADGKLGIVSFWIKMNDDDVDEVIAVSGVGGASDGLQIARNSAPDNPINIKCRNSSNTIILQITAPNNTFKVANGWNHLMASWDLGNSAWHLYVNGSSVGTAPTLTNDTIDYTKSRIAVGNNNSRLNACLAEFYLNTQEYIDLSVAGNRAKFYSGGSPVDLGSDGSTPTGSSPLVYLKDDYTSWETNYGTGEDLVVTGALTACSDAP